ncbi:MAG TPA: hypothetical protein VFH10_14850 [Nocardioides sp.]|uniref:hypothetical protein n=1 Tax=Nocardioides sp. TaxID=35761 RepID=UPI002D804927|nr:hypothetical protein [Nocardioides sp.]HET6653918.1 hypothetical protein [Nocardioides sp.]
MAEVIRLWHVTITVAGEELEPLIVRNGLRRLSDQRPFLHSLKYSGGRAEIQYWEEAESLLDASSLALRVWNEHRDSAGLPRWEVVGLEVLERNVYLSRGMEYSVIVDLQDVTPLPF